jgi:hypothetical protein
MSQESSLLVGDQLSHEHAEQVDEQHGHPWAEATLCNSLTNIAWRHVIVAIRNDSKCCQ